MSRKATQVQFPLLAIPLALTHLHKPYRKLDVHTTSSHSQLLSQPQVQQVTANLHLQR